MLRDVLVVGLDGFSILLQPSLPLPPPNLQGFSLLQGGDKANAMAAGCGFARFHADSIPRRSSGARTTALLQAEPILLPLEGGHRELV
jgi:hypothetical protein